MRKAYGEALASAKQTKSWLARLNDSDVDRVVDSILGFDDALAVVLDEQILFAYRINDLWFRPSESTLEEFSVLRIYPGSSRISKTIKLMEAVAKHYGCVSINSGTALFPSDERLARVYERAGFSQDSITLWKGLEE